MITKRWQFLAGVLAVLAASLACTISQAPASIPTPRPVPTSTPAPKTSKPIPAARPSPQVEQVSAIRALNVRADSTYGSAGIGVLYHGQEVRITGECRGVWAPIRYRGESAWVNSRYITGNVCRDSE